jgi:hypothetical protein
MPTTRLFARVSLILLLAVVPYSLLAQGAAAPQAPAARPALSWADKVLQQEG